MRLRRCTWGGVGVWGGGALLTTCLILYLLTDKALQDNHSPNTPPHTENWSSFADRLKKLERELNDHNAIVGEIRDAMNKIIQQDSNQPPQKSKKTHRNPKILVKPKTTLASLPPTCPNYHRPPDVDVQMMDVYERLKFDNLDGGVWKQGWPIKYDPLQWNYAHKLKVFIIPHSHNDPGWLKTFEEYYSSLTKNILDRILIGLREDSRRRFIWAEISYFAVWWEKLDEEQRRIVKGLLKSGQLEIVTGGWVMNDEANSHWVSIVQQLSSGHQWLKENLDVTPVSGWAIDPFGHSATQPWLLKLVGLNASLIQRTHYSVKKELAQNKQLEFRWRQTWDTTGKTELFTHMMPFYSYDVPHTCGPDPKVCCQFDFKRLPGYGLTCPWRIPPQVITERNVKAKSELILDQWRKKAQLYKTRTVLVPLGDDFRWDHPTEWDAQFHNYDRLIDYINSNESYNVEVRYGTLTDYFNAVMSEMPKEKFPSLSGDFFTYADRDNHYWSGYYTSRPYYKRMDRVLMSYVRAAEMIFALAKSRQDIPPTLLTPEYGLQSKLTEARQNLALFQHHDGVTGTARDPVVRDYGARLLKAIAQSQHIIQQSAYHLLVQNELFTASKDHVYFEIDDMRRTHSSLSEKLTITVGAEAPSRKIVFFNSLPYKRNEVVSLSVSTPFITIVDTDGIPINCQISPVFVSETTVSHSRFALDFSVSIPGLGLSSYIVTAVEESAITKATSFSKVHMYNFEGLTLHPVFPKVDVWDQGGEFSVNRPGDPKVLVTFSQNGLMKAIKIGDKATMPLHLDFVKYGTQDSGDKSGAYLFLPGGEARLFMHEYPNPIINIIEGPVVTTVSVQFPLFQHTVCLYGGSGGDSLGIEIINLVDINSTHNMELAMRLSTNIQNDDRFYTDLNGLHMIRRKMFKKLPIQANFYPMPTAAYIEDFQVRLTLLSSTSLGAAALKPGEIEVMQDRRLDQDDNRGLAQGVLDNRPTHHKFRLLVEYRDPDAPNCRGRTDDNPGGTLTVGAHIASQSMLNPVIPLYYSGDGTSERAGPEEQQGTNLLLRFAPMASDVGNPDLTIASYTDGVIATLPNGKKREGRGLIIHRPLLDMCFGTDDIDRWLTTKQSIKLSDIVPVSEVDEVHNSSLSYLHLYEPLDPLVPQYICPAEIKTYFFHR